MSTKTFGGCHDRPEVETHATETRRNTFMHLERFAEMLPRNTGGRAPGKVS